LIVQKLLSDLILFQPMKNNQMAQKIDRFNFSIAKRTSVVFVGIQRFEIYSMKAKKMRLNLILAPEISMAKQTFEH